MLKDKSYIFCRLSNGIITTYYLNITKSLIKQKMREAKQLSAFLVCL